MLLVVAGAGQLNLRPSGYAPDEPTVTPHRPPLLHQVSVNARHQLVLRLTFSNPVGVANPCLSLVWRASVTKTVTNSTLLKKKGLTISR
jgi:hypothetical protein